MINPIKPVDASGRPIPFTSDSATLLRFVVRDELFGAVFVDFDADSRLSDIVNDKLFFDRQITIGALRDIITYLMYS